MDWEKFFKAVDTFDWCGTLVGIGVGLFCLISLVRCALP